MITAHTTQPNTTHTNTHKKKQKKTTYRLCLAPLNRACTSLSIEYTLPSPSSDGDRLRLSVPDWLWLSVPDRLRLSVPDRLRLSVPDRLRLSVPDGLRLSTGPACAGNRPLESSPDGDRLRLSGRGLKLAYMHACIPVPFPCPCSGNLSCDV